MGEFCFCNLIARPALVEGGVRFMFVILNFVVGLALTVSLWLSLSVLFVFGF